MRCFSELTYMMYSDRELPGDEAHEVEAHLAGCAVCRQLVSALNEENRALMQVLQEAANEAPVRVARPMPRWTLVAAGLVVMAFAGVLNWTLDWLGTVPEGVAWLNPFNRTAQLNFLFDLLSYLILDQGATTMATMVSTLGLWTMGGLGTAGLWFLARRAPRLALGVLSLLLILGVAHEGSALEARRGDTVMVRQAETVQGSLVAFGKQVQVDGTTTGDLIVFGRALDLRGNVKGDLIFFGESAQISGRVDGNMFMFGRMADIRGEVARSLYAFDQTTRLDSAGRVGADLAGAGQTQAVDGMVGRDVWFAGYASRVRGVVGRDVRARVAELQLLPSARVGRNLDAHVRRMSDVVIEPGATIGGQTITRVTPPRPSRFTRGGFYFWQALQFVSALLVGFLGLVLVPGFFQRSVEAVRSWGRSFILGFVVLVVTPVAIVLAGLTLVGIPVALTGLGLYLLGLFAAKILVGAVIGRALLRSTDTSVRASFVALLLGLFILMILFLIPFLGRVIHFVVFCLGLGAFAYHLYHLARPQRA